MGVLLVKSEEKVRACASEQQHAMQASNAHVNIAVYGAKSRLIIAVSIVNLTVAGKFRPSARLWQPHARWLHPDYFNNQLHRPFHPSAYPTPQFRMVSLLRAVPMIWTRDNEADHLFLVIEERL
jgi:hypothetical protein